MRIFKVNVSKLFGNPTYNYEIKLKRDPPITILHGPNGSGKTVMFQLLHGLFRSEHQCRQVFWKYPLHQFRVTFENGEFVFVNGKVSQEFEETRHPVLYYSSYIDDPFHLITPGAGFRSLSPSMRNRVLHEEIDDVGEMAESLEEYSRNFFHIRKFFDSKGVELTVPDWYDTLISQVNVRLIGTNRLQTQEETDSERFSSQRAGSRSVSAIRNKSIQLRKQIQETLISAKNTEDTLNRAFPNKIVDAVNDGNKVSWPYDQVRTELACLKAERTRLAAVGLFDRGQELQVAEYSDRTLGSVLRIYIEDSKLKLRVYQELAKRIEAFKNILQSMLSDKVIEFTREGFEVKSEADISIALNALSSGEQHLIVLMYDLLFRESDEADEADEPLLDELVLLDEPEISLNILWQNQFVSTLEKICAVNQPTRFDIMLATHSPDILNGRIDLLVPLQSQRDTANQDE